MSCCEALGRWRAVPQRWGCMCLYQPPAREREHRGGRQPVALWGIPAEPRTGADCLQRPLRSRFRQRLTAGVRRLKAHGHPKTRGEQVTTLIAVAQETYDSQAPRRKTSKTKGLQDKQPPRQKISKTRHTAHAKGSTPQPRPSGHGRGTRPSRKTPYQERSPKGPRRGGHPATAPNTVMHLTGLPLALQASR